MGGKCMSCRQVEPDHQKAARKYSDQEFGKEVSSLILLGGMTPTTAENVAFERRVFSRESQTYLTDEPFTRGFGGQGHWRGKKSK